MIEYFCQHANLISPSQFESLSGWDETAKRAGFIATNNKPHHDHFEPKLEEIEKIKISKKSPPTAPATQGPSKKKGPKSKLEKKVEKSVKEKIEEKSPAKDPDHVVAQELKSVKPFAALSLAEPDMVTCSDCKKELPAGNLELHQIHCRRLQQAKPEVVPEIQKNKVKQNKPRIKNNPKNHDFDKCGDDDELLEAAMKTAGHCAFGTCSVSVRVVGFPCATCSKHFCSTHKYPESHGCRFETYT